MLSFGKTLFDLINSTTPKLTRANSFPEIVYRIFKKTRMGFVQKLDTQKTFSVKVSLTTNEPKCIEVLCEL